MKPLPPTSTLFPYTTLFRSRPACGVMVTRSAPRARPMSSAESRRSEEHTSELQSPCNLVCRLLLEKKKKHYICQINEQYNRRRTKQLTRFDFNRKTPCR